MIVLEVNVLPDQIEDNFTSYTANKKTRNQWFDDETVVGDMRYNLRIKIGDGSLSRTVS